VQLNLGEGVLTPGTRDLFLKQKRPLSRGRIVKRIMAFSQGDRIGPYEILSPIGAGGMGEVWKARDTRLDRIVAIKRMKGEHGHRFQLEPVQLPL
jgi:serine/threonine protein kinase